MGKLTNKDQLEYNQATLRVLPRQGWSWYCGYHDTAGSGDDLEEVQFMAGAHLHYYEVVSEQCEIYYRQHKQKEEL
jgi:hypothetical protein